MILETLIALAILVGSGFALVGSIGLVRFGDVYSRLHGPTKASTVGLGGLLVASALYFSTQGGGLSLHELLVSVFLFLTAPVSAHMLARAGLHLQVPSITRPPEDSEAFPETVSGPGVAASGAPGEPTLTSETGAAGGESHDHEESTSEDETGGTA